MKKFKFYYFTSIKLPGRLQLDIIAPVVEHALSMKKLIIFLTSLNTCGQMK